MIKTIKCLLLAAICFFAGSMAAYRLTLSREVVRIRVIANSDSGQDQSLKLKVRDAVLSDLENVPREALEDRLPELRATAQRILAENGNAAPVSITLGRERYERNTEETTLPSGSYETLCLTIGEGGGHNWWGVLYPKLCYGEQSCLETGTERRLRFFVLEKLDEVKQWVKDVFPTNLPLRGRGTAAAVEEGRRARELCVIRARFTNRSRPEHPSSVSLTRASSPEGEAL